MKHFWKAAVMWGLALWFLGYLLGFVFHGLVPPDEIGWHIMPIGVVATLWVLFKRIRSTSLGYYFGVAVVWTAIAIVFDYLFIALLLHPSDGYYKPDVYLYYTLTYTLPLAFGLFGRGRFIEAEKRTKVLNLFTGGTEVTNDMVQKALGVSDATATRYLDALERTGDIVQLGSTGSGVVYRRNSKATA